MNTKPAEKDKKPTKQKLCEQLLAGAELAKKYGQKALSSKLLYLRLLLHAGGITDTVRQLASRHIEGNTLWSNAHFWTIRNWGGSGERKKTRFVPPIQILPAGHLIDQDISRKAAAVAVSKTLRAVVEYCDDQEQPDCIDLLEIDGCVLRALSELGRAATLYTIGETANCNRKSCSPSVGKLLAAGYVKKLKKRGAIIITPSGQQALAKIIHKLPAPR